MDQHFQIDEKREELRDTLSSYKDCRAALQIFQGEVARSTDEARASSQRLGAFMKRAQKLLKSTLCQPPPTKSNTNKRCSPSTRLKTLREATKIVRNRVAETRKEIVLYFNEKLYQIRKAEHEAVRAREILRRQQEEKTAMGHPDELDIQEIEALIRLATVPAPAVPEATGDSNIGNINSGRMNFPRRKVSEVEFDNEEDEDGDDDDDDDKCGNINNFTNEEDIDDEATCNDRKRDGDNGSTNFGNVEEKSNVEVSASISSRVRFIRENDSNANDKNSIQVKKKQEKTALKVVSAVSSAKTSLSLIETSSSNVSGVGVGADASRFVRPITLENLGRETPELYALRQRSVWEQPSRLGYIFFLSN